MLHSQRIKEILAAIRQARIAVYGDFCLDAYWIVDPDASDVSIETGLPTQAVRKQNYTLGGASNIVANLAALEPARIQVIGAVGDDIFGREIMRQLQLLGVDTSWLVEQSENFDTITYCKRYLEQEEQSRIDFGCFNQRSQATDKKLMRGLENALQSTDVIVFNQQVSGSLGSRSFIDSINELFGSYSQKIVLLDSRHYADKVKHVYRKMNVFEAARLNGCEMPSDHTFTMSDARQFAEQIWLHDGRPVFLTLGSRGILVHDDNGMFEIPGIQLMKTLDPVGAGDTTVAALAACLAVGIGTAESAEFANYAAAVTVQKLFQTGTASGQEILKIAQDADYIYQPELAEDTSAATYLRDSQIEICCARDSLTLNRITHAVFDHDGTISTLRRGWEEQMRSMMMEAILGGPHDCVDNSLYEKVRSCVIEYIDRSTGIQTILQMEALVELVKQFGAIPREKVLDKFGYKEIYNQALIAMVNQRIARLQAGEHEVNDFIIAGALPFLQRLRHSNIALYLVSGTDQEDVIHEAQVLGYASLFDGGIYGAVGDIRKYSKKLVFENLVRENNLQSGEFACFGDGPVEISKCRNNRGIAVGVASDEIRRFGLSLNKRTRLIKAGAHFIIPDFSQADLLLEILAG